MWINENQPLSKNVLHPRKMMDIGYIPYILLKYISFLGVDKKKNQLNASERFQFGKYIRIITKNFHQVTELMTNFPMQDSKSTSKRFLTRTIFFFGLNIVYQLLARRLSNEIETMKNYSDMLEPFFAQIRASFTCTYLALVFSVNKWKSI